MFTSFLLLVYLYLSLFLFTSQLRKKSLKLDVEQLRVRLDPVGQTGTRPASILRLLLLALRLHVAMLMDLTKVAVVELIHADQHRAADMTIIPMAAPEEIRAILVVAKVF